MTTRFDEHMRNRHYEEQRHNKHVERLVEANKPKQHIAIVGGGRSVGRTAQVIREIAELERLAEIGKKAKATELRMLSNHINLMPKVYRKRNMNYVIVQRLIQAGTNCAGSTSSKDKCYELDIDPYRYDLKPITYKA